jgi:glycerol uptake facilitator-like aquaporin
LIAQRLFAEFLGSLLLSGVVIGSGILAARLSGGNDAIALLGNTGATAAILFVLVTAFGPISGAHFNPAVTLVMALIGRVKPLESALYVVLQIIGCIGGAMLAHAIALVLAILLVSRARPSAVPAAVALTIAAGYWWTASTSFANPAITIARALSDTFAGIRPEDVAFFIAAQLAGALTALAAASVLQHRTPE